MLTVTETATAQLDSMLAQAPEEAAVRLVANGNVLESRLDQQREGDTAFKHGEKVVLLVEPGLADALSDRVLDTQATGEGIQLTLTKADSEGSPPEASG